MRIVNRKTFLELPAGIVYLKFESPDMFYQLAMKMDTCGADWYYLDLIDPNWTGDMRTQYIQDVQQGKFQPINLNTIARDGLYEEHAMFLIYHDSDVEHLIDVLQTRNPHRKL